MLSIRCAALFWIAGIGSCASGRYGFVAVFIWAPVYTVHGLSPSLQLWTTPNAAESDVRLFNLPGRRQKPCCRTALSRVDSFGCVPQHGGVLGIAGGGHRSGRLAAR